MATSEPRVASPKSGKRQQVMVGALPADFLRLRSPTTRQQQIEADAAAAQMLQQAEQWASYKPAAHHNIIGHLNVTVTQAKLTKNYGLLTKMDPYARIRMGHMVYETPTAVNGAKNPRWNKSFLFKIPQGVDSLYLEIYDERTFNQDEKIAWAHITVPSSVFQGDTIDDWYTLTGRQGDEKEGMINLVLSFTDISKLPPAPVMTVPGQQTYIVYPPGSGGLTHGHSHMNPFPPTVPTMNHGSAMHHSPPAVQQPAEITDAEVGAVHELFPSMEREVVRSVLEAHAGDQEATVNALLLMAEDNTRVPEGAGEADRTGVAR